MTRMGRCLPGFFVDICIYVCLYAYICTICMSVCICTYIYIERDTYMCNTNIWYVTQMILRVIQHFEGFFHSRRAPIEATKQLLRPQVPRQPLAFPLTNEPLYIYIYVHIHIYIYIYIYI